MPFFSKRTPHEGKDVSPSSGDPGRLSHCGWISNGSTQIKPGRDCGGLISSLFFLSTPFTRKRAEEVRPMDTHSLWLWIWCGLLLDSYFTDKGHRRRLLIQDLDGFLLYCHFLNLDSLWTLFQGNWANPFNPGKHYSDLGTRRGWFDSLLYSGRDAVSSADSGRPRSHYRDYSAPDFKEKSAPSTPMEIRQPLNRCLSQEGLSIPMGRGVKWTSRLPSLKAGACSRFTLSRVSTPGLKGGASRGRMGEKWFIRFLQIVWFWSIFFGSSFSSSGRFGE